LSSLLDVPAQLALALSLAAATVANEPLRAPVAEPPPHVAETGIRLDSVAGPYRFGERNWLRALKEELPRDAHGYAQSIFRTSGGRYYVPRASDRSQILAARDETELADRAARAFAHANARTLCASLKRRPTVGELYIAHLFGPEAAAQLIVRARTHPGEPLANFAPEIADKADALFGAHTLTVAQLYSKLTTPLAHVKVPASEPSIADLLQRGATWGALRPNAIAWQTVVSATGPQ
jgi:hypothetical protein